jgi:hypothetical protein
MNIDEMNIDEKNKIKAELLEKDFESLQKKQEESLLIDFDAAIKEAQQLKEKKYIKFHGKMIEIEKEMPFSFSTFFFRNCYKKINGIIFYDVPDDKIYQFLHLMFGAELMKELEKENKLSLSFVFESIGLKVLEMWGYSVQQQQNSKKKY